MYSERHMEELHLPVENLDFGPEKPQIPSGILNGLSSKTSLGTSRKRQTSHLTGPLDVCPPPLLQCGLPFCVCVPLVCLPRLSASNGCDDAPTGVDFFALQKARFINFKLRLRRFQRNMIYKCRNLRQK
jgi:hypothetical protein